MSEVVVLGLAQQRGHAHEAGREQRQRVVLQQAQRGGRGAGEPRQARQQAARAPAPREAALGQALLRHRRAAHRARRQLLPGGGLIIQH